MHEYQSVKDFVTQLLQTIPPERRVKSLCVRRGADFSEESVRFAFSVHANGTALQEAELLIERTLLPVHCACGHHAQIASDALNGMPFLCPACDDLVEIHYGPVLELIDLTYEEVPALRTGKN